MAYALDKQHARLVRAYARLRDLYARSLRDRAELKDALYDAKLEAKRSTRELKEHQRASKNTMAKLLATTQFGISHLVDAGDMEGAERLSDWLEDMRDAMQPVANVPELLELLDEWLESVQENGNQAAVFMKTTMKLNELRGKQPE